MSYSTVLFSKENQLLGATIAKDEQWRFPPTATIPEKFKTCILQYEDAYFYKHPGFNPVAIAKAVQLNIKKQRNVRGASTITQQVIRLSRGKQRTYWEKFVELILATRLELRESKDAILKLYMHHAPFGGNVVGIEMAAWRYFGTSPDKLSWAESATLAVLPNAPSLIFPGKNKQLLKKKRDFLLHKLFQEKLIDSLSYQLAIQESLPQKPVSLPLDHIHLLSLLHKKHQGERIQTSISYSLQNKLVETVSKYHKKYKSNNIHNLSAVVIDIETKKILAYVGNTNTTPQNHKYVDMVQAQRSTGSTLKPILYMAMLNSGELMPSMLVADIPTQIQEYNPENYDRTFTGAIPVNKAIAKSLNVPAVRLLRSYGLQKFHDDLNFLGLRGVNKSIDHYGLPLILGGAESSLWDITNMYANLASTVNHYNTNESRYHTKEHQFASLLKNTTLDIDNLSFDSNIFDAGSIYKGFEAMTEVVRPDDDLGWKHYTSAQKIAWKTGTSFGNKDAWSIGVNKKYAVGIWVGNADGEGIAELTGVKNAAPVMFDVFESLPNNQWFDTPWDALQEIEVCAISGHKPTELCTTVKEWIPLNTNHTLPCPYHKEILLDENEQYRVFKNCIDANKIRTKTFFVLPANQAWYYKRVNSNYVSLPPVQSGCINKNRPVMDFLSPTNNTSFILAKDFNEKKQPLVVKVSHQRNNEQLFWYVNERYVKTTEHFHELTITPDVGKHTITVVDQNGNQISRTITIE
ncbi:penicillin-binding protein 1C [Wenyingzhuangia sp. IMCC45574]